jgi:ssDNA-binding Zn-finger/Zn-ribbon topoisomerase 1
MEIKYMLICRNCPNKIFTDGKTNLDQLREVPTAAIPLTKGSKPQTKKYKCPECGYIFHIVRLKKDEPPVEQVIDKKDENPPESKTYTLY